jgi:mannonate dehydratase
MYIGEQLSNLSDARLTLSAQLGVEHVAAHTATSAAAAGGVPIVRDDGTWDVRGIEALQRRLSSFGLTLDVLALDVEALWPSLLRGAPDRQARLDVLAQNIRAAAEAGVPCLKYRVQPIGIPRTGRVPGRGGAQYSHFDVREWTDHTLSPLGRVSPQQCWDAIAWFLERVVPVAEASRVRLACHPQDPALPPDTGLRGMPHVLGSVEGLQRFLSLCESPYHGLNFCQGTVAEMCVDPATEVLAAIRHFGAQRKIFMVHFRNIKGGALRFDEVYPDNGDVDMYQAVQAYKDVGFEGMLCPDHVPLSTVDPGGERQFAFCLGYTRALIHAAGA